MEKTNLQKLASDLGLTNLQIVALNGIGRDVTEEGANYFDYEETLTPEEDDYLRTWLRNEGFIVIKGDGVILEVSELEKWKAEHPNILKKMEEPGEW
ncbi:MAG: hypothetical protein J6Q22_09560 [Prevotella sp.]|nr:hypothetical protein [Prevotella sp.]